MGNPDFYFPNLRLAIFVDGCFWHGCKRCFRAPQQNASFWSAKIAKNRQRDRDVVRLLRREGVKVIRVREHELKNRSPRVAEILEELRCAVQPGAANRETRARS